jgi:methanogenic corrinoid protein MtbC1
VPRVTSTSGEGGHQDSQRRCARYRKEPGCHDDEGAGFKAIDLGINTPIEKSIEVMKVEKPDIVGMSALLTTTMGEFKKNMEALERAGLRDEVKVMVGGAPVSERYALDSGADVYGGDAIEAVEKAKRLVGKA